MILQFDMSDTVLFDFSFVCAYLEQKELNSRRNLISKSITSFNISKSNTARVSNRLKYTRQHVFNELIKFPGKRSYTVLLTIHLPCLSIYPFYCPFSIFFTVKSQCEWSFTHLHFLFNSRPLDVSTQNVKWVSHFSPFFPSFCAQCKEHVITRKQLKLF